MGELGRAALHGVEGFEGRAQLARGVEAHGQPAGAHLADLVGEALGVGPDAGRVPRPGRDHPPLGPRLSDGRRGERARAERGTAGEHGATIEVHGSFSAAWPPTWAATFLTGR